MTKYRVIGNHAVDGVEPGGYVEVDDPELVRFLQVAGHINTPAPKKKKATKKVNVSGDFGSD